MMTNSVPSFLKTFVLGDDGIFGSANVSVLQGTEHQFRETLAQAWLKAAVPSYLDEVSKHHSIPVMDREVERFVSGIPNEGIILDVGGCWGWHWRRLTDMRPDIRVVIVDFVRSNLLHAMKILDNNVRNNIHFVHADAVSLEFPSNTFDGYWSVQALQHIPDLHKALKEAKRVLKPTGVFVDYSLNDCLLARLVYRIMRKQYVVEGMVRDSFFLRRMTDKTLRIYSEVFSTPPKTRYSEIIFKPEFRFAGPGREDSFLGKIDCWLSGSNKMLLLVARQRSTHISMWNFPARIGLDLSV